MYNVAINSLAKHPAIYLVVFLVSTPIRSVSSCTVQGIYERVCNTKCTFKLASLEWSAQGVHAGGRHCQVSWKVQAT